MSSTKINGNKNYALNTMIPNTGHNYLSNVPCGSQSNEARSSYRESHYSVNSTKVPLVMRHCYANNEAKKKLVEAN